MLKDEIVALGRMRHDLRVLPKLAYLAAEAAERGEVDEDDAQDLYLTYYEHTQTAKRGVDPGEATVRVQVSKLRQIIKSADPELLDRVTKAHAEARGARKSLYTSMVAAARLQAAARQRLSDRTLRELVLKK